MIFITGFLFFLFGSIFGSFLNVCIYRLPRGQSIVFPASHCPACKAKIPPYDNIPLFSFILLRGKCRFCGVPISPRYPLVEFLTGTLFSGLFLRFGLSLQIIAFLFLALLLIIISFIDIEFNLILNKLTIPGIIAGSFLTWKFCSFSVIQIGLGVLIGSGALILIAILGKGLFKKESMGMGDVKMAAMIGVFLGAKGVLLALFLSFLIAGMFSFAGLALKKIKRTSYIPFGPFIAAGTFVYIFWGEQLVHWYLTVSGLK